MRPRLTARVLDGRASELDRQIADTRAELEIAGESGPAIASATSCARVSGPRRSHG